jgi:hypothetical protein
MQYFHGKCKNVDGRGIIHVEKRGNLLYLVIQKQVDLFIHKSVNLEKNTNLLLNYFSLWATAIIQPTQKKT